MLFKTIPELYKTRIALLNRQTNQFTSINRAVFYFFLSLHSLYFIPKPNVTQRKIINYALKHTMANVLKSFLTLTPFWLLKSVLRHWMAIFICEKNKKEKENYSLINNNNEILSLMPFDMVANQINNTQSTCSFHQTEALFCNRGEH